MPDVEHGLDGWALTELEREGARRVYRVQVSSDQIAKRVAERLKEMGQAVRIPGYRPGTIPLPMLESRYGARARSEVLRRIGGEVTQRMLAGGSLPASFQCLAGELSGDADFRLVVTRLPDLEDVRPESWSFERPTVSEDVAREFGVECSEVRRVLTEQLQQQVLDQLDAAYPFPLAEFLVAQELELVRQRAGEALAAGASSTEEVEALNVELRAIAERRVRLGAVVVELARRHRIAPADDPGLETRVLDWLLARARVVDRALTLSELREMRP